MGDSKFKPGQSRHPKAGRKKGTPNKKTLEFMEMLEENDFNPGEEYIALYRKLIHAADETHDDSERIAALSAASSALNNICQFVYPKKKAVEHSGRVGFTFTDLMAMAGEDE